MKTILRKIVLIALALVSFTAFANEKPNTEPKVIKIKEGHKIKVIDASGEILYNDKINYSGNLKRLFDFSQLKNGNYTVEINKDFTIEINSIHIKNNKVTFNDTKEKLIFKPVFRTLENRILISKLATDISEMDVKLYYKNEIIHTETIKGKRVINRVYKIDETIKGEYTAVVKFNNRVFIKNFNI